MAGLPALLGQYGPPQAPMQAYGHPQASPNMQSGGLPGFGMSAYNVSARGPAAQRAGMGQAAGLTPLPGAGLYGPGGGMLGSLGQYGGGQLGGFGLGQAQSAGLRPGGGIPGGGSYAQAAGLGQYGGGQPMQTFQGPMAATPNQARLLRRW